MKINQVFTVLIALLFSSATFAQTGINYYELADTAYDSGDYQKSAELFVQAFNKPVDDRAKMYAAYNAACSFSLNGDKKEAIKYAKAALDNGMLQFKEDKDFDNIKNKGKFKKIIKAAAEKIKELESPASMLPITYTPKGYKKEEAHPLIVILHGYGGNPTNIMELYKPLADARGAILLSCRGSEITTANSFYWDYDNEEALTFLRRQIESTIKKFNVDMQKVILTGFSQGGYLTYDFGLKNADIFTALLPVAGKVPQKLMPHQEANKNIKVYSIAGLQEPKSFLKTYEGLDEQLDELAIEYQLKFYNIGHQYPNNNEEELLKAFDWLVE